MLVDYLAAYDYGTGAVWIVVSAQSADAITHQYPELQVVDERPVWLDDKSYARLERHRLDAPPTGLLQAIVAERPNE